MIITHAGVAHPVERHLAKVEVASSSLVTRSKKRKTTRMCGLSFLERKRLEKLNVRLRWSLACRRLDGGNTKMFRASSPTPKKIASKNF